MADTFREFLLNMDLEIKDALGKVRKLEGAIKNLQQVGKKAGEEISKSLTPKPTYQQQFDQYSKAASSQVERMKAAAKEIRRIGPLSPMISDQAKIKQQQRTIEQSLGAVVGVVGQKAGLVKREMEKFKDAIDQGLGRVEAGKARQFSKDVDRLLGLPPNLRQQVAERLRKEVTGGVRDAQESLRAQMSVLERGFAGIEGAVGPAGRGGRERMRAAGQADKMQADAAVKNARERMRAVGQTAKLEADAAVKAGREKYRIAEKELAKKKELLAVELELIKVRREALKARLGAGTAARGGDVSRLLDMPGTTVGDIQQIDKAQARVRATNKLLQQQRALFVALRRIGGEMTPQRRQVLGYEEKIEEELKKQRALLQHLRSMSKGELRDIRSKEKELEKVNAQLRRYGGVGGGADAGGGRGGYGRREGGFGQSLRQMFNPITIARYLIVYRLAIAAMRGFQMAARSTIRETIELDRIQGQIAKVLPSNARGQENLNYITTQGIGIAKRYGISLNETVEAMALFYQQGLRTEEVLRRTDAAMKLATVTGLQQAKAVELQTAYLNIYGDALTEVASFSDKLVGVEQKHAITAGTLSEAFLTTSSTAKEMGVSFETLLGLITAIGVRTRETGSKIGTALRFVLPRFLMPESIRALSQVGGGIPLYQVDKQGIVDIRNLEDVLYDLARAWGDLNRAERISLGMTIAQRRRMNSFVSMMSGYKEALMGSLDAHLSVGKSMESASVITSRLDRRMQNLKTSWQEFAFVLSQNVVAAGLISFVDVLTRTVTAITRITAKLPKIGRPEAKAEVEVDELIRREGLRLMQTPLAIREFLRASALAAPEEMIGRYIDLERQIQQIGVPLEAGLAKMLRDVATGAVKLADPDAAAKEFGDYFTRVAERASQLSQEYLQTRAEPILYQMLQQSIEGAGKGELIYLYNLSKARAGMFMDEIIRATREVATRRTQEAGEDIDPLFITPGWVARTRRKYITEEHARVLAEGLAKRPEAWAELGKELQKRAPGEAMQSQVAALGMLKEMSERLDAYADVALRALASQDEFTDILDLGTTIYTRSAEALDDLNERLALFGQIQQRNISIAERSGKAMSLPERLAESIRYLESEMSTLMRLQESYMTISMSLMEGGPAVNITPAQFDIVQQIKRAAGEVAPLNAAAFTWLIRSMREGAKGFGPQEVLQALVPQRLLESDVGQTQIQKLEESLRALDDEFRRSETTSDKLSQRIDDVVGRIKQLRDEEIHLEVADQSLQRTRDRTISQLEHEANVLKTTTLEGIDLSEAMYRSQLRQIEARRVYVQEAAKLKDARDEETQALLSQLDAEEEQARLARLLSKLQFDWSKAERDLTNELKSRNIESQHTIDLARLRYASDEELVGLEQEMITLEIERRRELGRLDQQKLFDLNLEYERLELEKELIRVGRERQAKDRQYQLRLDFITQKYKLKGIGLQGGERAQIALRRQEIQETLREMAARQARWWGTGENIEEVQRLADAIRALKWELDQLDATESSLRDKRRRESLSRGIEAELEANFAIRDARFQTLGVGKKLTETDLKRFEIANLETRLIETQVKMTEQWVLGNKDNALQLREQSEQLRLQLELAKLLFPEIQKRVDLEKENARVLQRYGTGAELIRGVGQGALNFLQEHKRLEHELDQARRTRDIQRIRSIRHEIENLDSAWEYAIMSGLEAAIPQANAEIFQAFFSKTTLTDTDKAKLNMMLAGTAAFGGMLGGGGRGANLGATLGALLGAGVGISGGPTGAAIGSAIGSSILGAIGGTFDDLKDEFVDNTLALRENTQTLKNLEERLINVPAGFTLPVGATTGLYGGAGGVPPVQIIVQGGDPNQVESVVRKVLRGQGLPQQQSTF